MLSKFVVEVGENCVACGACENVCPREAIKVKISMLAFRPRTWCVYCPMGTMTQGICKIKYRDKN